MHIAIFRNNASPLDINSYNVQEIGLAKELVNTQINVTIFALFSNENHPRIIYKKGNCSLTIHPLRGIRLKNDLIYSINDNKINIKLFDLIQVQEYSQIMNIYILYLAKRHQVRTVIYQGMYKNYEGYKSIAQLTFDILFKSFITRTTDIFLAKTKSSQSYLKKKGFYTPQLVPVGLDIKKLNNTKVEIHNNSTHNALYIGKIEKRRNPNFLLDLAIELKKANWTITIIGKGPLSAVMKKRIKDEEMTNVVMIDEISQDKIARYYQEADVFLLPSNFEIFGMVVLESLYFGTPVISTPTAGPKSIINDDKRLGTFQKLDIKQWSKLITNSQNYFPTDSSSRIYRHNYVENEFSWSKICNIYLSALGLKANLNK